jgi:hypothetical protein
MKNTIAFPGIEFSQHTNKYGHVRHTMLKYMYSDFCIQYLLSLMLNNSSSNGKGAAINHLSLQGRKKHIVGKSIKVFQILVYPGFLFLRSIE